MRSEERIHEELCCKEMRKHVFQSRTGKIVCSHTAACAKNKTENRKKNRDEGHKDWETHVRKVLQRKKKKAAKGVGGSMLLSSFVMNANVFTSSYYLLLISRFDSCGGGINEQARFAF